MKITIRPLVTALAAVGVAGVVSYAALTAADATSKAPPSQDSSAATPTEPTSGTAGLSANMYFVDEHGNPRMPTAAEMRTLADALKRDLAGIAGPHRGKRYERTLPSGAVAATVATSVLVFLTATGNGDGTVTIRHSGHSGRSGMGGDVVAAPETTATAPEM